MRLQGQVIAVTGAGQGYGRSVSSALAAAGASVILVGDSSTLAAHASSLEQAGGAAIPMLCNVSSPSDWLSTQNRILEIFGVLSGVVHLADHRANSNFTVLSENEWMELFNRNVKSTVGITQLLQRYSPETWLTIIGPHLDEPGMQAYPQRGALRGLVERAAQEGSRLNMLLPSRASSTDEQDQALCEAVLMLAAPQLLYLRGSVLDVPLPAPSSARSHNEVVAWW